RAAEDREVLAEDEHQATIDGAVACDNAVAWDALVAHAEVGRAMLDEHVPFFEGAVIEEKIDPLAGGQFALCMLRLDAALPTAQACRVPLVFELTQDLLHDRPRLLQFYDTPGPSMGIAPRAAACQSAEAQCCSSSMKRAAASMSRLRAARRMAASASSPH